MGLGTVKAITYGGKNVNKVIYRGQIIWERVPPTALQNGAYLQDATPTMCADTPPGTTVDMIDQRDGKYYRVRKMADSRCWMIDDLSYALLQGDTGTTPSTGAPAFSPSAQVDATPSGAPNLARSDAVAQYYINNNIAGQGQIPNNGNPTPSYLYNWCAAMGDTSASCATTRSYGSGQPTAPQVGICPGNPNGTGFRLPIGGAAPTTPGNGTNQAAAAATTTNEFAKLDIWLGGTGVQSSNTYSSWTGNGTSKYDWSGASNGFYLDSKLNQQGAYSDYWNSTGSDESGTAYFMDFFAAEARIRPVSANYKYFGFGVRCVL